MKTREQLTKEAISLLKNLIETPSFHQKKPKQHCYWKPGFKRMKLVVKEPKIMFGQRISILIRASQQCC